MPFTKGISGNPAGRPKGSENKISERVKELLHSIVESELEAISKRLTDLPLVERTTFLIKILPYVIGKVKEQDSEEHFIEQPLFPDILHQQNGEDN